MNLPMIVAHGALGPWDETIFISVVIIFVVMMGISWFRSRGMDDEPLDAPSTQTPDNDDTFRLE
jgi:hypothetical protein